MIGGLFAKLTVFLNFTLFSCVFFQITYKKQWVITRHKYLFKFLITDSDRSERAVDEVAELEIVGTQGESFSFLL